jgi:hypothetical protein
MVRRNILPENITPGNMMRRSMASKMMFRSPVTQSASVSVTENLAYAWCHAKMITPLGCPDIFPRQVSPDVPRLLKAETTQYTAFSDGFRNVYTDADAAPPYSTSGILDPGSVSFLNLFVNGVLQSPNLYAVRPGMLILSDIPPRGAPLILQFVKITLPSDQGLL